MPNKLPDIVGSRLVIDGEDIPFGAYQAIYHQITKKTEKRFQNYSEAYRITHADLKNLHLRVVQTTKQYNVQSSRCQITQQFKDDSTLEHSSFEKFQMYDCTSRSPTKRITYTYDFLVILPPEIPQAENIAQRTTIKLVLEQRFGEDFKFDGGTIVVNFTDKEAVNASIEFSDFAVSQALFAAVDHWVAGLPRSQISKTFNFFKKSRSFGTRYVDEIVRFITILAAAQAALHATSAQEAASIVLIGIGASFGLGVIVHHLTTVFYEQVDKLRPQTLLLFSQGDHERDRILREKRSKIKWWMALLFVGILLNGAIGLMVNRLYDVIK